MPKPIDYRTTAVDHAVAALELIQEGDDYLTQATVTKSVARIFESNKPVHLGVYASDELDDPAMNETKDTIDIVVQGVVRADAHVFRGVEIGDAINMVITDIKKALEVDRKRGIQGVFKRRTIRTSFDFEENFGALTIVDRYEHRRPCT